MLAGGSRAAPGGWRRGVALAALTLAALALHAGLLSGLEWPRSGAPAASPVPAALAIRVLAAAPPTLAAKPAAPPPAAPAGEPVAPAARLQRATPRAKQALAPATRAPTVPVAVAEVPVPAESIPTLPVADATSTETAMPPPAEPSQPVTEPPAPPPPPGPSNASDRELPVYRTLIPPPVSVRYLLQRGALRGTGELQWLPQGERYEARLEGRLAGIALLTQVSQGGFDDAGVAPLRFTDQRAAGAVRAANFQREAGKISFSGPSVEYPLLMGSQDRLSWMVQLAAVVAAEPQRLQQGGRVVIHVVGARGDSRLWVFRFVGLETIAAGAGTVQTARFVRDAAEAYDTRVEVWLDPLRHHLPARAVLRSGPDDEGLELTVQEAVAVP